MSNNFFQNLFDILRNKLNSKADIIDKYENIKKLQHIDTLILGSSHMNRGYIPILDNDSLIEFNMATTSQDLYSSYNLYEYCMNLRPEIKNIIISYSVFSRGHSTIRTSDHYLCVLLKLLFGINYQYEDAARKNHLYLLEPFQKIQIKHYLKHKKTPVSKKKAGIPENENITKIEKHALKHYKNYNREVLQTEYLEKIIQKTKENHQTLIVVIPPANLYYKKALPDGKEMFKHLEEICAQYPHIKLIDVYNCEDFAISDFVDADHLSKEGAIKFSNKIRNIIY